MRASGNNHRRKAGIVKSVLTSLIFYLVMILASGTAAAFAQSIDPHRIYEQNCSCCHAPHAGDFVHETLVYSDNRIIGRVSGKDVRAFLEAGHGKLTPDEIASITAQLTVILKSGRIFRQKCLACHDRAVTFARLQLVIRDGELIGRYSKRNIEAFLSGHGRLEPDEVSRMVDVLKRQLETEQQN